MRLTNREITLASIAALLLAAITPALLTVSGVLGATFTLHADCTATTGAIISALKFNNCTSGIATGINAIDNDRVATGAGIVGSKLNLTSGTGRIQMSPAAFSGVPSTTGSVFNSAAVTFTDSDTAASGTAAAFAAYAFQRPTLAASNTSVTTTAAATVYIANSPAAGTNQTLTNAYALWVDDGAVRLDGTFNVAGATTLDGAVTLGNAAGDNITVTGTITSNVIFTDATYDIGASGATRPRNIYASGVGTFGGAISGTTITGTGLVTGAGFTGTGNVAITPAAVSGTPAQHGLYRENVVKVTGYVQFSGGVPALTDSFNIASITDTATGRVTVTIDRDFANTNYAVAGSYEGATGMQLQLASKLAGSVEIQSRDNAGNLADQDFNFLMIGDQ